MAVSQHGRTTGWESIALAVAAAFIRATADLDPRRRTYSMWVPFVLAGQLQRHAAAGPVPAGRDCRPVVAWSAWWLSPGRECSTGGSTGRPPSGWALFRLVALFAGGACPLRDAVDAVQGVAHAGGRACRSRRRDRGAVPGSRRGPPSRLDRAQKIGGASPATALVTLAARVGPVVAGSRVFGRDPAARRRRLDHLDPRPLSAGARRDLDQLGADRARPGRHLAARRPPRGSGLAGRRCCSSPWASCSSSTSRS